MTFCLTCGLRYADPRCPHVPAELLDRMRRDGVRKTPVCRTCDGDEQVPLVGAPGGQFAPCPDCVILGVPRSE